MDFGYSPRSAQLQADTPYASFAGVRDQPVGSPQRMPKPRPRPPLECRPLNLSVTEIETWLRDQGLLEMNHV